MVSKHKDSSDASKDSLEKNLLLSNSNQIIITGTKDVASMYDEQMFSLCWAPATAAMSVIFDSGDVFEQPVALDAAQDGFLLCAQIASHFNMIDVFDAIAISLCKFTSLLLYAPSSVKSSTEPTNQKKRKHKTTGKKEKPTPIRKASEDDSMSIHSTDTMESGTDQNAEVFSFTNVRAISNDRLGLSTSVNRTQQRLESTTKAQLATIFVFAIAQKYGNFMRDSWPHLTYCLLRLADLDLVPVSLAKESQDKLIDRSLRNRFHENVRRSLLKSAVDKVRKEKERNEYAAVGWISNWLFGETGSNENSLLNGSPDHFALLSGTRIADGAVGRKAVSNVKEESPPQLDSGSSSANKGNGDINAVSKRNDALECIKRCHLNDFVGDTRSLSDPALLALMKALVVASGGKLVTVDKLPSSASVSKEDGNSAERAEGKGAAKSGQMSKALATSDGARKAFLHDDRSVDKLSPPSMASWLFGLHLITEISIANFERIETVWHLVEDRFLEVIQQSKAAPNYHLETVSVGLLRIASVILSSKDSSAKLKLDMLSILHLLLAINETVAPGLATLVAQTCKTLFVEDKTNLLISLGQESSEPWHKVTALFILMAEQEEEAAMLGFETVRYVLVEGKTKETIPVRCALAILMAFTNRHGVENSKVAEEALGLVFSLHTRLEPMIKRILSNELTEPENLSMKKHVVEEEWIPLITEVTGVIRNPQHPPSTQFSALNHLKKALLDVHGKVLSGDDWGMVIEKVLFALCESVLNAGVSTEHEKEAEQTRAYGVMTLIVDVVKQHKSELSQHLPPSRFESLWIQLIKYLERFKKIIPGDEIPKQLEELEQLSRSE